MVALTDLYRFYVEDLLRQMGGADGAGGRTSIRLSDDQAHHARSVLRMEDGQRVVVFDGAGAWCEGEVVTSGKREICITAVGPVVKDEPPRVRLTLAVAVPKGERAQWLVEQASQLYVMNLQWLSCDRGVVKPREGGGKLEKWRRLAIESAKQCGRSFLMAIEEPVGLDELLESVPRETPVLWLDPRAAESAAALMPRLLGNEIEQASREVVALIGPEGGWSPREEDLLKEAVAKRRLHGMRLTPTVLRIETAAVAVAALLLAR